MNDVTMLDDDQVAVMDLNDIPSHDIKPTVSKDELFYAVATESQDPIQDWKRENEAIVRTGQSSLYNLAQEKWMKSQDDMAKAVLTNMMLDSTVPDYQKQASLNTYIAGGYVDTSLRSKYLINQASIDNSVVDLDRHAQDIIANHIKQRDQQALQEEGKSLIEEADIDFSDVLKGTGAVASQIGLNIPAGLAAAYSIIKDRDPEKANKIIKSVQAWGYSPDDAGAQKVISLLQEAAEVLDIPFKWLGDKVLEFTGSPGAATIAYTASSAVGYLGAYKGVKSAVKGVRKSSPMGTTTTANPVSAKGLATAAIADPTGELAKALGTTKEAIISDYTLSKLTQDLADRPDLVDSLVETDHRLSGLYKSTEIDPDLYPKSALEADKAKYVAIMTQSTGPKLLQSRSVLDFEWTEQSTFLKGQALFGRDSNFGYTTELAAETAANQLRQSVKGLPEEGNITVITRKPLDPQQPPEYFVQWKFKREYEPFDHLTMGEDALSAHLFSKTWDVTKAANSTIGTWFWPAYMRMKTWIPSIGQKAGWRKDRIQQQFLEAQKKTVLKTKHTKELSHLLTEGEELGKVWSLAEVKAKYQNLSKEEAETLYYSYYGYRRIEDYMYQMSDRKFRYSLEKEGYQTLYDPKGNKIGFASDKIKLEDAPRLVWDFSKKEAVPYTPDTPIVRLRNPVRVIDDDYQYAILGRNKLGPIRAESLPRVPGYITRHYKDEWYVLDREPTKKTINGHAVYDLGKYRQTVAMGATKEEILRLQKDFQDNYADSSFHWRKERKDIEDKIMFDAEVYDTYFREHLSRGHRMNGLNRQARIEDPLVAQTRAIAALSKLEAFAPYMEHARKEFVRSYGEFTQGKFPDKVSDINGAALGHRLTPDEEAKLLAAQRVYQQLELQQFHSLASDEIWKSTLHSVADIFEKAFGEQSWLRSLGQKGFVPAYVAKALGAHLWLYTRPFRMWLVQPQQYLELSSMNAGYFKSSGEEAMPLLAGLLSRAHTMRKLRPYFDKLGANIVTDYDKKIQALLDSGVMQAVDTNQMIHGIWKDSLDELNPSKAAQVASLLKKAALTPSRVGRAIGYDPAELLNQVTLWLYAKHKWTADNAGKDWSLPENAASISQLAGRLGHLASTRAGLMPFQDGLLGTLAQFVAIPHKSFMMMLSHPDLTGAEKARLFAARMLWYGKWGIPGGAAVYTLLEPYMDDSTAEDADAIARGASDWIMNKTFELVTEEESDSYWSKGTSTVPNSLFHYDFVMGLADMINGEKPEHRFPFANAINSWFDAGNAVAKMYWIPTIRGDEPDWSKIAWEAARFVTLTTNGTAKDIEAALMIDQLTKTGQKLGHQQTTGEIIGTLFGIRTGYEELMWELQTVKSKREKFIKDKGQEIHATALMLQTKVGPEERDKYWESAVAWLRTIPEEYHDDIIREIQKKDRYSQTTMGDSIAMYILKNYQAKNDGYMSQMRNLLKKTGDDRLTQVNEVME